MLDSDSDMSAAATPPADAMICKIVSRQQWDQTRATGVMPPSPIDITDGYIHLSSAAQVPGTLAAHFAGRADLVVLYVRIADVREHLRWEVSRGGELFPHLYGDLPRSAIDHAEPVVGS